MALLMMSPSVLLGLFAMFAAMTAQISARHSIVKRKVTGDKKLYVFSNRTACVSVKSQDICPVDWKLPQEFALAYAGKAKLVFALVKTLDIYYADDNCKELYAKILCSRITPKCLVDGGKDFRDARAQCDKIYSSTCPAELIKTFEMEKVCEDSPTGKYNQSTCVANPRGYVSEVCPQPKHKMPADIFQGYKTISLLNNVGPVELLKNFQNMFGIRVFSTECLNLIKEIECLAFYCSDDGKRLLVELDFEDCELTKRCYARAIERMKIKQGKTPLKLMYASVGDICPWLPRRATGKLEEAALLPTLVPSRFCITPSSARGGKLEISKILYPILVVLIISYL